MISKHSIGVLYLAIGFAGVGTAVMRGDYSFIIVPAILIAAALYIMHLTSPAQS